MVRLGIRSKTPSPQHHGQQDMPMINFTPSPTQSFRSAANDNMSYITDVSSVTYPDGLGQSYSNESMGDADESYFSMTEVSSALTGWTGMDQSNPAASNKASGKDVIDNGGKLNAINERKSNTDELSIIVDSSDDGSMGVQSITDKLKTMIADNWNPRPMSINANKAPKNAKILAQKPLPSPRPPLPPSPKTPALIHNKHAIPKETIDRKNLDIEKQSSPKPALKSNESCLITSNTLVPSSPSSSISSIKKKRLPVPQMKDPSLDDGEYDENANWEADCNYDINPTLMFQMLESGEWNECAEFLDGKTSEGGVWNFSWIQTGIGGGNKKPNIEEMQARQKELQSQARTWVIRREKKSGVLKWRMLPIHAALVFNAPFDVVLRLYHLYPGGVRCRNDLGMLPLHHVFMYGNEDRILELFLDVFPGALSVVDDKGRLPLGCTPQDGSDNERRSNILDLYSKFQVEFSKKLLDKDKKEKVVASSNRGAGRNQNEGQNATTTDYLHVQQYGQRNIQQRQPMQSLEQKNISSRPVQLPVESPDPVVSLGIAPRYTQATHFNDVPHEAMRARHTNTKETAPAIRPIKASRHEIDDDKSLTGIDRYASMSDESASENTSKMANLQKERAHLRSEHLKFGGLNTIQEDGLDVKNGGVKKMKKGLKKMFKRSTMASI